MSRNSMPPVPRLVPSSFPPELAWCLLRYHDHHCHHIASLCIAYLCCLLWFFVCFFENSHVISCFPSLSLSLSFFLSLSSRISTLSMHRTEKEHCSSACVLGGVFLPMYLSLLNYFFSIQRYAAPFSHRTLDAGNFRAPSHLAFVQLKCSGV